MAPCIFCKIIRGELPSHTIYEDDQVIAFLDIQPLSPGHTLIAPKVHTDHLWDLTSDHYSNLLEKTQEIALHLRNKLSPQRVGLIVEGFDVQHVHCMLVPMNEGIGSILKSHTPIEPDHSALSALADQLAISES